MKKIILQTMVVLLLTIAFLMPMTVQAKADEIALNVGQTLKMTTTRKYRSSAKLIVIEGKSVKVDGYMVTAVKPGVSKCQIVFADGEKGSVQTIKVFNLKTKKNVHYEAEQLENNDIKLMIDNENGCYSKTFITVYDKKGNEILECGCTIESNEKIIKHKISAKNLEGNKLSDVKIVIQRKYPKKCGITIVLGKPTVSIG